MSHHGNDDEQLRAKMNHDDAGGIAMAVGVEQGRVVLRFPKPVAWVGFTAGEAIALAESLVQNARKTVSKKLLTFTFGA